MVLQLNGAHGGGKAPRMRPDGPDAVMQSALDGMDRSRVRDRYVALCRPEVTEFEDAAQVAGEIFAAVSRVLSPQ